MGLSNEKKAQKTIDIKVLVRVVSRLLNMYGILLNEIDWCSNYLDFIKKDQRSDANSRSQKFMTKIRTHIVLNTL